MVTRKPSGTIPQSPSDLRSRCPWCGTDPLYVEYHDTEWGVPSHDDGHLFEVLVLEGAQAGLSWITILRKREAYRAAFAGFDAATIAGFTPARIERLLLAPGIVRNRLKVEGAARNAKAFLQTQEACGSFDRYIWQFVAGAPIVNSRRAMNEVPPTTPESDAMSKDMRSRGFTFVGSTICYAFMQAAGMVNDHLVACFRYGELTTTKGTKKGTKNAK